MVLVHRPRILGREVARMRRRGWLLSGARGWLRRMAKIEQLVNVLQSMIMTNGLRMRLTPT